MISINKSGKLSSSRLYSTQLGKAGFNPANSYLKVNPVQSLNKDGFVPSQGSEEISVIKARIQQLPEVDAQKIKHLQQSMVNYHSDGNRIADRILSVSIHLTPSQGVAAFA